MLILILFQGPSVTLKKQNSTVSWKLAKLSIFLLPKAMFLKNLSLFSESKLAIAQLILKIVRVFFGKDTPSKKNSTMFSQHTNRKNNFLGHFIEPFGHKRCLNKVQVNLNPSPLVRERVNARCNFTEKWTFIATSVSARWRVPYAVM